MSRRFSAAVDAWARKSEQRMDLIVKESAQRVGILAQTPRAKGGRLPVDTAFLRNTFTGQIGTMPSGPSKASEGNPGEWEAPIALTISNMRPGDVLYMGWTAAYARKMEERYGFAKGAAMQWQSIVREVTAEAKARVR